MKLKNISALLLFLFVFTFSGFSQVEDEEVMFNFSGTRSIGGQNKLDFGTFKAVKTLEIELKNPGKTDMKIGQISIPEGVGIVILNEVIKPGATGKIAVTIDPKFMKSGNFTKPLTISTISVDDKGTTTTRTATVSLVGQLL